MVGAWGWCFDKGCPWRAAERWGKKIKNEKRRHDNFRLSRLYYPLYTYIKKATFFWFRRKEEAKQSSCNCCRSWKSPRPISITCLSIFFQSVWRTGKRYPTKQLDNWPLDPMRNWHQRPRGGKRKEIKTKQITFPCLNAIHEPRTSIFPDEFWLRKPFRFLSPQPQVPVRSSAAG